MDGALFPNGSEGGVGGVLRDARGRCLAAFAHHVSFVTSAKHAEPLGLLAGLQMLQTRQITDCLVETDCLVAVSEIQLADYQNLEYGNLN